MGAFGGRDSADSVELSLTVLSQAMFFCSFVRYFLFRCVDLFDRCCGLMSPRLFSFAESAPCVGRIMLSSWGFEYLP